MYSHIVFQRNHYILRRKNTLTFCAAHFIGTGMKRFYLIGFFLFGSPAWAQEAPALTPLQQYLYGESGYVVPQAAPQAPAPEPVAETSGYTTAYMPYSETGVLEVEESQEPKAEHLNEGVRGMTW